MSGSSPAVTRVSRLDDALRQCSKSVALAVGLSFVSSVSMLIPPIYMLNVFGKVLNGGSIGTLLGLTLLAFGGIALYGIFNYLRARLYIVLGRWLDRRLGDILIEAIVAHSLQGQGNPGQSLRDISDLRNFVSGSSLTSGFELLWSPLFITVLFILHPAYGALCLGGGAVLITFAILNEVLTRDTVRQATERSVEAHSRLGSALRNAEVIRAMGMMPEVLRLWRGENERTLEMGEKAGSISSLLQSLSKSFRLMLQICTFGLGAYLILNHQVAIGSLIAASILMGQALGPIEGLIGGWRAFISAGLALKRLRLVARSDENNRESATELSRPTGHVEIDRVVFIPPSQSRAVIKGVRLSVTPGETIALVGPSGAGKSTLVRLIVGVWQPSGGAIRLDGHDIGTWNRSVFGRYVGYMPQSVELFSATVRQNIARLNDGDPASVINAARLAGIHGLIGQLPNGYDTDLGNNSHLLTGGQRQRLALARALYGEPALLVLDEPDANLDSEGQAALIEALRHAKQRGCTVILVTHRPSLLETSDRVVVMNDGAIEKITTADNLFRPGPAGQEGHAPRVLVNSGTRG